MDSKLVPYGRRLRDLDACEYLSFIYGQTVEGMSGPERSAFDASLLPPRVRSDGSVAKPPPSWAAKALQRANSNTNQSAAPVAPAHRR